MVHENNIDWLKIFSAYKYYESIGFDNINVDWTVERQYTDVTKPVDLNAISLNNLDLIGSAEQVFIQMIDRGQLPKGRYMALTPCFRDEIMYDLLHRQYFMKLELIETESVKPEYLKVIIDFCANFFSGYCDVDVIKTGNNQYDINEIKTGIELGSYGIREWKNHKWIYATGLAEPRLSTVMEILKKRT